MNKIVNIVENFLKAKRLKTKIVAAVLGGSWARGEAGPSSDIDLMLFYKDKYAPTLSDIHLRIHQFKGYNLSVAFQSEKEVAFFLKNPDPSVISFLREAIIVYDPLGRAAFWIKKARGVKIFASQKAKRESKRRLKERIGENIRRIKAALEKEDTQLATYLLRGTLDEIVEKLRMYDEDWLYSQRKTNLKYLAKSSSDENSLQKLFSEINESLPKERITRLLDSLKSILSSPDFP